MKRNLLLLSLAILLSACRPVPIAQAAAPTASALNNGAMSGDLAASVFTLQQNTEGTMVRLVPLLAETGQPTPGFEPASLGENIQSTFSAENNLLIYTSRNAPNCERACLHVFDLRAWKETIQPIPVGLIHDQWIADFAYDPQRQRVAFPTNNWVTVTSKINLVDLSERKVAAQMDLEMNTNQIDFTADGKLAINGEVKLEGQEQRIGRVGLLDASSLRVLWQQDLTDVHYSSEPPGGVVDPTEGLYLSPAIVESPLSDLLYIVTADEDRLVTIDFARREVKSAAVEPARSWLDRLVGFLSAAGMAHAKMLNGTTKGAALSPDGRTLYVVGETNTVTKLENGEYETEVTPLGLQVIDTADGTLTARLETDANGVHLSPDGQMLFLSGWKLSEAGYGQYRTDVVEVKDLKTIAVLKGDARASRLLNGGMVWLVTDWLENQQQRLAIFDPERSGKAMVEWVENGSGYVDWVFVP